MRAAACPENDKLATQEDGLRSHTNTEGSGSSKKKVKKRSDGSIDKKNKKPEDPVDPQTQEPEDSVDLKKDKPRDTNDLRTQEPEDSVDPRIQEQEDPADPQTHEQQDPADPSGQTDPFDPVKLVLEQTKDHQSLDNLPDLYKRKLYGTSTPVVREELPDLYKSKEQARNLWHGLVDLLIAFVLSLLFAIALRFFVIDMYAVTTGSMEPTIATGDHILADKVTIYFKPIQRGDIVFFDDPEVIGRILVKRVIAVGGQQVIIRDGKVYIDGVGTFEPYTHDERTFPLILVNATTGIDYPYIVPEGYLWVLGDHRENSLDSRIFGAVPENAVLGRAVLRIWPLESFGFLD